MQKTKVTKIPTSAIIDLSAATGSVAIKMTTDYLFRALLQRNNRVLKGLIRSLLHLSPEEITSVEITNPIELGTSVDDYNTVKPVIQIGLLDFTLFPEHPEFYATYKLINEKNFSVYSSKLRLSVVDLTHIDLATEEDRLYGIDLWASFFKAATWEELKMLAHNNTDIQEAVATVYKLTQEEKIRQQCEAREDYYRRQNDVQRWIKKQDDTIQRQNQTIEQQAETIAQLNKNIDILKDEISELHNAITQLQQR